MTGKARPWTAGGSILVALLGLASIQPAVAQTKAFNVPAQSATTGIPEFARQAGIQILVSEPLVRGKRISAVTGSHSIEEALGILLKGTGLTAISKDGATYTVAVAGPSTTRNASAALGGSAQNLPAGDSSPAPTAIYMVSEAGLEQVIITAQKRSERLQDVPVPVSAISADTLVDANQLRLQEYFALIPGLSFTSGNRGEPFVAIRGVSTSAFTNPTVGNTVDDLPVAGASLASGGFIAPDVDPNDLARIEVLRGPQGTLYGVSSLGGLIKYVTVDPTTDVLKGRLQAGMGGVYNGAELGYSASGAVNVPLSDTFAVRASAFTHGDPGYVDNVQTGERGVNKATIYGGKLSTLWAPSDAFSLKLAALLQQRNTDGSALVYKSAGLGDLQQTYPKGSGWSKTAFQAYSATIAAKLGVADLTSLTGYNDTSMKDSVDLTPYFGYFAQQFFGVSAAPYTEDLHLRKFTQEIRLSAPLGDRFQLLVGGFYTHEEFSYLQGVLAVDPITGVQAGTVANFSDPGTFYEYAAFADLTVKFSDRLDIQVGGRQSHNKESVSEIDSGLLFGGATLVTPPLSVVDSPFTYLVTPRFRISPDFMIYARIASGYRAGGVNLSAETNVGIPASYTADKTQNYEIGVKGNALDHRLSFDASLYYIDWNDIQLAYISPAGLAYTTNGSPAKSQGVEFSLEAHPMKGLAIASWVAWNDAQLTENLSATSAVVGAAGDRLPYSSRFSGNISIDQEFNISSGMTGSVGGSVSYVGDRKGVFQATPTRQDYPAYTQVDARAGLKFNSWTANLYVTNLTDERGEVGGGLDNINPEAFILIRPRTVGVSFTRAF